MTLITKKHMLRPYLAIYMVFSRCALFTKATPTNLLICHDFNCHINERETPTTCLINHKSSISHHIMPLVINSLGGGHTHTHTHTCILILWTKAISRNRSCAGLRLACAWFKNVIVLWYVSSSEVFLKIWMFSPLCTPLKIEEGWFECPCR